MKKIACAEKCRRHNWGRAQTQESDMPHEITTLEEVQSAMLDKVQARREALELAKQLQHEIEALAKQKQRLLSETLPDHEWEGRRVWRIRRVASGSGWRVSHSPSRAEGIVRTFRTDSPRPENLSAYSLPEIGTPVVYLLTKAGKEGKRFERLDVRSVGGKETAWALIEGETYE
jgi:hypothetical protein